MLPAFLLLIGSILIGIGTKAIIGLGCFVVGLSILCVVDEAKPE